MMMDMDNNDYGVSLYHIDIALIPDTRYANWKILYTAKSLERIRTLVNLILKEAAQSKGHTYLSREENYRENWKMSSLLHSGGFRN